MINDQQVAANPAQDGPQTSSSSASSSSSTSNSSSPSSSRLAPQFAPRDQRPSICGPEAPERPYPIYLRGEVEKGFGRGGKDLGCPTANLPSKVLSSASALSRTGIYYGFARVLPQDPDDPDIDPSLSLGGGIESAKDPTSPNQDQLDEEVEESDYYDEDEDDDDQVVLGASPVTTEFADKNLNGNLFNSTNGNGSHMPRSNSLRAGVERIPKPKSRQGSKSSTKSNKSIATLMAKLGSKSDSTSSIDGEESNKIESSTSNQNSPIDTSQTRNSSHPIDSNPENASSNLETRPMISTSDLNSNSTPVKSSKHPRNLSAASSSSSLKRNRKKPRIPLRDEDSLVFPMVMSVGWNPFYNNKTKTAEVHIIHKFARDFYGLEIRVVVLGYIRPEYNYVDRDSLIEDIETDKKVGIASLERRAYQDYAVDPFLGRQT